MPFTPRHSALKPLIHPVFRALWLATVFSNIGTWMQSVSAAWVMTSLTTSSLMVALLQAASSLPTVFLSLPAGALADITDRRRLMIGIQAFMVLMAGLLTALYFFGVMTPALLLFFTFAIGIGAAMNAPAWFATTPELVPREDLMEAVTLNGIGVNAARAIGPAIAGIIISLYSPGFAFAINALSFVGLIVALLQWKHVPKKSALPAERFLGSMKAGLRYVRQSQHMHVIFLHTAGFFGFASAIWALMPLVARNVLQQTAVGYGVLLTSMGLGSIVAAFLLPLVRHKFERNSILFCASVMYGAGMLTLGSGPNIFIANLALFVMGISWIAAVTSLHVSAQTSAASWVRARALSVYLMVLSGGMGFGSIVWGWAAEHIGVTHALDFAALGLMISALLLRQKVLPMIGEKEFEPSPPQWNDTIVSFNSEEDERSVLVTVEYIIELTDKAAFLATMEPIERIRRRDGAVFWGIFQGVEEKGLFTECFVVESWLEHLRQHERVTTADRRLIERAREYHKGEARPKVSHRLLQV